MAAPRRTQIGQQYDALERAEASAAGVRRREAELSLEDSAGEQQVQILSSLSIIINL